MVGWFNRLEIRLNLVEKIAVNYSQHIICLTNIVIVNISIVCMSHDCVDCVAIFEAAP